MYPGRRVNITNYKLYMLSLDKLIIYLTELQLLHCCNCQIIMKTIRKIIVLGLQEINVCSDISPIMSGLIYTADIDHNNCYLGTYQDNNTQVFIFFCQLVVLLFQCHYSLRGSIVNLICHSLFADCVMPTGRKVQIVV